MYQIHFHTSMKLFLTSTIVRSVQFKAQNVNPDNVLNSDIDFLAQIIQFYSETSGVELIVFS